MKCYNFITIYERGLTRMNKRVILCTAQHSTAQHSTAQHSTAQANCALLSYPKKSNSHRYALFGSCNTFAAAVRCILFLINLKTMM